MSGVLTLIVGRVVAHNVLAAFKQGTAPPAALLAALIMLGLGYGLGAICAAKGAFRVFVGVACVMLLIAGGSLAATVSPIYDRSFFHALSVEAFGMWSLFLALALIGEASRPSTR